jgi:2-polyprenyl-6-methoxyphenol hydroxylase-like FAD-dependent oxidoreductase
VVQAGTSTGRACRCGAKATGQGTTGHGTTGHGNRIRAIETPYKRALPNGRRLGRDPLAHFARGRVCVTGDAAYPTLPFLAQGANMALEDATRLARCLDAGASSDARLRHENARLV